LAVKDKMYLCRKKKSMDNKVGIFGPIYDQFQSQPKLAIKHLESTTFRIVIQTRWNNQEKVFLLTAFDLRKKPE